jgi:hypothetical protein
MQLHQTACRIVDEDQQGARFTPILKPAVVTPIDLDQVSKALPAANGVGGRHIVAFVKPKGQLRSSIFEAFLVKSGPHDVPGELQRLMSARSHDSLSNQLRDIGLQSMIQLIVRSLATRTMDERGFAAVFVTAQQALNLTNAPPRVITRGGQAKGAHGPHLRPLV